MLVMDKNTLIRSIFSAGLLFSAAGCAQMELIFHQAPSGSTLVQAEPQPLFLLASHSDSASQEWPATQPSTTQPTASTASTTAPARAVSYTEPRPQFQPGSLRAFGTLGNLVPAAGNAGKELSESVAFSSQGVIGRSGLTAPPTMLTGAVIGRPGLQRGPATGLGFASPSANIFVRQFNPLSGPNGRCHELARAGFFGGSAAACTAQLRR